MYNLSKGKIAPLLLIDEAIELIKTEIRILSLRIQYPEQFQKHKNTQLFSTFYLTDETTLINIMELVSSLFLSKRIIYNNGAPVPLSVITKSFEVLFNIKLGDCYKKHESVISRKPIKLTEFLDELRKHIIEERENKGFR